MTNNSDGLSPTLRPQLGVGFNRALPAPFGFDNGFIGNGSGYFKKDANFLEYKVMTFEFWFYWDAATYTGGVFYMDNGVGGAALSVYFNSNQINVHNLMSVNLNYLATGNHHAVLLYDLLTPSYKLYINGVFKTFNNSVRLWQQPTLMYVGATPSFSLTTQSSSRLFDEVRIYNRILTEAQINLNYNNGVGNNPFETENLLNWYKFENFETLDFSALQDGSDLKTGINDFSGKKNHIYPVSCDTNPVSGTYVLKPF